MIMKQLLILTILFLGTTFSLATIDPDHEGRVIGECLERFGGLTPENAVRLQRFRTWSATYEEMPCFTNCYLSKMFNFYNEAEGFNEELLLKYFKRPAYEACKDRLTDGEKGCQRAYNGFHCLVSLENDPFIIIESMENLSNEAKTAMKDCLRKFDQYEWDRISDYSSFPVREPIPCFTKCFLDKLQLFNVRLKQWNLEMMHAKLGVPSKSAKINNCEMMTRRRNRNSCAWMYKEFTCFVLAKETK